MRYYVTIILFYFSFDRKLTRIFLNLYYVTRETEEISCQNPLTEHKFREEWKRTHAFVMMCEKSERMLLGGALWSVCFDLFFSYQTVKSKFEEKTFKVRWSPYVKEASEAPASTS